MTRKNAAPIFGRGVLQWAGAKLPARESARAPFPYFLTLRFVLTLFPKPAKRLTIRVNGASGLSRTQREILAWLWLLEASDELAFGSALKWRPRKDEGNLLNFYMPSVSASTSRALARLEQRGLVIRDAPNGRTVAVWLTHAGRSAGEIVCPQFREPFRRRVARLDARDELRHSYARPT